MNKKIIGNYDYTALKGKSISIIFGCLFSFIALSFAFENLEVDRFFQILGSMKINFLIFATAFTAVNIWLRVNRWIIVSHIKNKPIGQKCGWTGYLLNFILPVKLGELVKIILASRLLNINYESITISTLFDRLFDFYLIMITALISIYILGPDYFKLFSTRTAFTVASFITITLVALFSLKKQIFSCFKQLCPRYINLVENIEESLEQASFRKISVCLSITSISFLFDVLISILLLHSLGLKLSPYAPFLITSSIYMSAMIPSAPAQLGLHQAAAIISMGMFSIGENVALAYSLTLQIITFSTLLVGCLTQWLFSARPAPEQESDQNE